MNANNQTLVETMSVNNLVVLDTLTCMDAADKAHDDMVRKKLVAQSRSSRAKVKEGAVA